MDWLAGAAAGLESSGFGAWARGSPYAYPAANVAHLLGLVLLVGSIGLLDLRLLGLGRSLPLIPVARLLTPIAVAGLLVAAASGSVLLAADATKLLGSATFGWKMALLAFALTNAFAFRRLSRDRLARLDEFPSAIGRAMAIASLATWLAVGALGRLIAYT